MSATRAVRSLEHLETSASTARVLNLRAIARKHDGDPEHQDAPMFKHQALNKAIIVKHRLRQNEQDVFNSSRRSATKVLLPIENGDLRMGARYLFIGQRNFADLLYSVLGIAEEDQDARTLAILDDTPSLDPFLLREQLKRHGVTPAPCYFDISDADMARMFDFAHGEIQQLVVMSMGGAKVSAAGATKLARMILTNANDKALEPLRLTMQLNPSEYQEGMFCWKAFLYYKWRLRTVMPQVAGVVREIEAIVPRGFQDDEAKAYLRSAKGNIRTAVATSCRRVSETLAVYDDAYESLTRKNDPMRFRDFLLQAPALFNELGERLGGVEHIISFWRFRFPPNAKPAITVEELVDIFTDFEQSLNFSVRE